MLTVARYIHQNPVKSGISSSIDDYQWSSFKEYKEQSDFINTNLIFSIIDKQSFIKFNYETDEDINEFDEYKENINEIEFIRKRIKDLGIDPDKIGLLPKVERNKIIKHLRKNLSIRQIERATGISRGIISRC